VDTRPAMPPARSDIELVTSYGYRADEVQTVTLSGNPTGTFKLTFTFQMTSATTDPIDAGASAAAVQGALQALSTIGSGNVFVTGPNGGPWQVRFAGTKAETNVNQMTAHGPALVGGTARVGPPSQGGATRPGPKRTDPRALVGKTDFDLLGRTVRTIENFVDFLPSATDDRTTEFAYDGSNHVTVLTAVLPGNAYEKTQYVYGVTQGPTQSDLYSN